MKSTTINITYNYWCWPSSPGWHSVCQVSPLLCYSFPILSILCSLERPHYEQPTLKEWWVMLYLLEVVEYLHKLLRILLPKRFASSPQFIILSRHLFISVGTHGYYLTLWVIIQYHFILFFKFFKLWPFFSASHLHRLAYSL